jgi:hypothetical protein
VKRFGRCSASETLKLTIGCPSKTCVTIYQTTRRHKKLIFALDSYMAHSEYVCYRLHQWLRAGFAVNHNSLRVACGIQVVKRHAQCALDGSHRPQSLDRPGPAVNTPANVKYGHSPSFFGNRRLRNRYLVSFPHPHPLILLYLRTFLDHLCLSLSVKYLPTKQLTTCDNTLDFYSVGSRSNLGRSIEFFVVFLSLCR